MWINGRPVTDRYVQTWVFQRYTLLQRDICTSSIARRNVMSCWANLDHQFSYFIVPVCHWFWYSFWFEPKWTPLFYIVSITCHTLCKSYLWQLNLHLTLRSRLNLVSILYYKGSMFYEWSHIGTLHDVLELSTVCITINDALQITLQILL